MLYRNVVVWPGVHWDEELENYKYDNVAPMLKTLAVSTRLTVSILYGSLLQQQLHCYDHVGDKIALRDKIPDFEELSTLYTLWIV